MKKFWPMYPIQRPLTTSTSFMFSSLLKVSYNIGNTTNSSWVDKRKPNAAFYRLSDYWPKPVIQWHRIPTRNGQNLSKAGVRTERALDLYKPDTDLLWIWGHGSKSTRSSHTQDLSPLQSNGQNPKIHMQPIEPAGISSSPHLNPDSGQIRPINDLWTLGALPCQFSISRNKTSRQCSKQKQHPSYKIVESCSKAHWFGKVNNKITLLVG